ncbi:MAG: alpha/beta hydrolase [Spirochaetales bacterium]|nr:alpha/beta hydrolase [Spirochaetales bacterium]MCF7936977.1 alpha/beta hydrolase [Spirochaetales bacterium]
MKRKAKKDNRGFWVKVSAAAVLSGLLGFAVVGCAGTDPITDERGNPVEGSISSLEKVMIGGTEQSILIRGHDREAPVLLWLAGGPGGSELGWTRKYLNELERDVVFVNWEQPGAGKSFYAADYSTIEIQDYVDDLVELSLYLAKQFGKDRIFLAGHSWGSIIGLMAAEQRPDLFHAYIAVAQHVNAIENDRIGYRMVLEGARKRGHQAVVDRLKEFGPPPYKREHGERYIYLFQKLPAYTPAPAGLKEPAFKEMAFPEEYSLLDSLLMVRGLLLGVKNVYPQLADLDFERSTKVLKLPVFFMTGRYDETCDQDIAYRYFQGLEAPKKEFFWFEKSGHNLCYQENDYFIKLIREEVLPVALNSKGEYK